MLMHKQTFRSLFTLLVLGFTLLLQGVVLAAEVKPLSEKERREFALLSPFEFKNELGDAARAAGKPVFNAGRGNPNYYVKVEVVRPNQ